MAAPTTPPPDGTKAVPLSSTDDTIPAFIRQGVDVNKVQQKVVALDPSNPKVDAYVSADTPNQINIAQPDKYTPAARNHELTHIYQDSREGGGREASAALSQDVPTVTNDPYDYSGQPKSARSLPEEQQMQAKLEGLQKARNQGKTIAHFNPEQQAEMVADYKKQHDTFLQKVKEGSATKQDLQRMSDLQNTYHPFMEQMANLPRQTSFSADLLHTLLGRPPAINTQPAPPGLPSFATPGMGMVTADPLMGGKSQRIAMGGKK